MTDCYTRIELTIDVLEKIRHSLHLSLEKYASYLRLRKDDYCRLLMQRKCPSVHSIECLAEQLDLCPEAILEGRIDFKVLVSRFSGNPTCLPEKYAKGAMSKRRTSVHLLDSLDRLNGWRVRDLILRRLQMNEAIFIDRDATINIQFLVDLCEAIKKWSGREEVLFEMGKSSVRSNYHTPLGEIYRSMKVPKQIYERTFPELANRFYDNNSRYQLQSLSDEACQIRVTPNPELQEIIQSKRPGSSGTCEQRRGVIASYPAYLGLPDARVVESQCIHRGDFHCSYQVNFEGARWSLANRE